MLDNLQWGYVAMQVGIGVLEVGRCDFIAFGDGSVGRVESVGKQPFVRHGDVECLGETTVSDAGQLSEEQTRRVAATFHLADDFLRL